MKKILLITNGHAEDLVADKIIGQLGQDYETIKLSLVDPTLPSGGFSLRNFNFLLKDLASGLLGQTVKNLIKLIRLRGKVDLTVAIGDIVPIIAAKIAGAPFIFVGVNKSSYYQTFGSNYTPWEKKLLKKARKVFVRDSETLKDLPFAEYVGNPLMDIFASPLSPIPFPLTKGEGEKGVRGIIGFLPGTRSDAKLNLEDFAKIAKKLPGFEFITATKEKDLPTPLQNRPFAQVLEEADLIIGLSGTGNEQAAGCGIPVISFPGRGSQYNKKFARAQKELLGEALMPIDFNDHKLIAQEARQLLNNPQKMKGMGEIGRQRMGQAGACQKIADYIKHALN